MGGLGKNITKLRGKRIDLCVKRNDDKAIEKYVSWFNDEAVSNFVGTNSFLYSYENEKMLCNTNYKDVENFNIVLRQINNDYLIGLVSLRVENYTGIINIFIGESQFRGRGYGTDALKTLIKYCFEEKNLHRLELSVASENERAIRCYKSCGFEHCGTRRENLYYSNTWHNSEIMELLHNKYNNLR